MTLKYADSGVLPSGVSRFEPPTSDSAKEHFLDQAQERINETYTSPESYSIEKSGVFRSYQLQTPTDGKPPQPSSDPDGELTTFTNNTESISNKERSIFASSGLQSVFSNALESKKAADEINDFTIFNTYKHYYSVVGKPNELVFVDTPRKENEQNNDTLRPLEIEYLSTAVRSRFTFNRYPFD
tara:strand:+ start:170 stop:721 length:552 start_codon:yes stop_codon:yes gene_type:complete